jgi:hypothetical protein
MRIARVYRYRTDGTEFSLWERWTLSLLKILVGLSVGFFDFALLLLVVKESSILSYLLPSTWGLETFRDLLSG